MLPALRYILLDRITLLAPPERATGVKCVSLSDDVFVDHFPGFPIFPGALIVEGLAQLAGVLLEQTVKERGERHALLSIVERAKFRRMVKPGDRLEYEATVRSVRDEGGLARAVARVEGEVAAEAELTFAFTPVQNPRVAARRAEYLRVWLTGSAEEP
jgi:3-hydroxymyristoyl/3-hydroxydecanoyl-(acyl carrier protein) dehydratase